MQQQQIEGQRARTILVVESDESTRRILDLSLRHAGFAVRVASNAEEGGRRLADRPDLIIVGADNDDGLDFCRRAKQAATLAPAVVLMLDPGVDSKRRGLEAGADDFVARPIYVQEVVARSRALLQRRDRERLELSAHDNQRFVSSVADVPLVDLLRAIAANQKSGVALVMGGEGARGELYFRQGRVVDAEVGRLSGRDAVYRLFCWSSGSLAVEWKSIRRKDTIEMATHDLLMEALRRVDEWRRLLAGVPALDTIFEVDYRLLAERLADIPDEVNRILRLFDGVRTFLQVIDDCGLPDLDGVAAIGKLYRERIIHDIRVSVEDDETVTADMEGWLSDAAGPFRSPSRPERDLFGGGPDAGVGVHGRRTAPMDPLGEGSREALDDDMRVRFTDRLQAEGATAATEAVAEVAAASPTDGIPELPLEALIDSAPAGNGTRPSTLPGMGAAKDEASRSAASIAVAETPPAFEAAGVPDDVSPLTTLQGSPPPPPPPHGDLAARTPLRLDVDRSGPAAQRLGRDPRAEVGRQPEVAAGRAARARARGFRPRRTCASRPRRRPAARERSTNRRRSRPQAEAARARPSRASWRSRSRQQDHQGRRRPRRRVLQGRRRGRAGRVVDQQEGDGRRRRGRRARGRHRRDQGEDRPQATARRGSRAEGGRRRRRRSRRSPVQPVIVPIADTRGASSGPKPMAVAMDATGAAGRKAGRAARRRARGAGRAHRRSAHGARAGERGASAAVRVPHGVRPEADA